MFGFIIGTASLIGLVTLLRRRHWYAHGGWGWHGERPGGGRRTWMLRWLFRHLDTTAGQEKVFNEAAEDLEGRMREIRSDLEQLRKEMARGLRLPQYDPSAVREAFAQQRARMEGLEEALVAHLGKIHEALDERQRGVLAELVQDGPRRAMRHCGGGYHSHGHRSWRTA